MVLAQPWIQILLLFSLLMESATTAIHSTGYSREVMYPYSRPAAFTLPPTYQPYGYYNYYQWFYGTNPDQPCAGGPRGRQAVQEPSVTKPPKKLPAADSPEPEEEKTEVKDKSKSPEPETPESSSSSSSESSDKSDDKKKKDKKKDKDKDEKDEKEPKTIIIYKNKRSWLNILCWILCCPCKFVCCIISWGMRCFCFICCACCVIFIGLVIGILYFLSQIDINDALKALFDFGQKSNLPFTIPSLPPGLSLPQKLMDVTWPKDFTLPNLPAMKFPGFG